MLSNPPVSGHVVMPIGCNLGPTHDYTADMHHYDKWLFLHFILILCLNYKSFQTAHLNKSMFDTDVTF